MLLFPYFHGCARPFASPMMRLWVATRVDGEIIREGLRQICTSK